MASLSDGQRTSGRLHRSNQSTVQRAFPAAPLLVCSGIYPCLFTESRELFQPCVFLVRQPVRSQRFSENALGIPDCLARQRRERAFHYARRTGQHVGTRKARLTVFYQRQSRVEHGTHELSFGTNTRILRLNDYDFGRGNRSDRHLHHLAAIYLRRRLHGNGRLSPRPRTSLSIS